MTRRLILPAALLLGLAAGCSSTTAEDPATGEPSGTATLSAEAQVCEDFSEGMGTPLAERAEAARTALTDGAVEEGAPYGEINALEQRIAELGSDAPTELATLLEEVNAPLTEAVAAVNSSLSEQASDGEEPGFPDLSQIDVSGSAAAQDELESACRDAGYGA